MVRRTLATLVLVPLLGLALASAAQTQKWDQLMVTEAASKLATSVAGLRDLIRGGGTTQTPTNRKVVYQIMDNLRQLEFSTHTLKIELGKGAGMEETQPTYNRIQQLRRDTEVLAQKVDITAVVRPKLEEAKNWLKILEPFYPPQPVIEDLR